MTINPDIMDTFCAVLGEKYRDTVTEKTTIDDIEEWDSYSFIELVYALEKRFNIQFSAEEIAEMIEVKKINDMVEMKVAKL